MPTTTATGRTARLEKLLNRLTLAYHRRKRDRREYAHPLLRCHRISTAYLESLNADRLAL